MKLLSGTAHPAFAEIVARHIPAVGESGRSIPLTKAEITRFSDGEIFVEIGENVRGEDVFVIQSTSHPANENLMELLIMVDALRRGSAQSITAVIPYYGYARQDRKNKPRVPITARLIANMLEAAGVNRVLTIDLHANQIQGFFDIPVDNLFAQNLIADDIRTRRAELSRVLVVAPDMGGVPRARSLAKKLEARLAIIDKRRPAPNQSEVMHIIGDVEGLDCILIDDMVDTAGTLCSAARALKQHGAKSVCAYATHGVLSGQALSRIDDSSLTELVVSNTIPPFSMPTAPSASQEGIATSHKLRYIDIAPLMAEAIERICAKKSVSSLFS